MKVSLYVRMRKIPVALSLCWIVALQGHALAAVAGEGTGKFTPGTTSPSTNTPLQGAAAVLRQVGSPESGGADTGRGKKGKVDELRRDLRSYSSRNMTLSPAEAARQWLALADRFSALTFTVSDLSSGVMPISFQEVIAVLPPPEAWDALLQAVAARQPLKTKKSVRDTTLLLLAHALVDNKAAIWPDAAVLQAQLSALAEADDSGSERDEVLHRLRAALLLISPRNVSSPTPVQATGPLPSQAPSGTLVLNDLVTLVGTQKATAQIRQVLLTQNVQIEVPLGDETRHLAQRLALQLVGQLKVPQWSLAQSVSADSVALFEALEKRFSKPNALPKGSELLIATLSQSHGRARIYHLLGLIVTNRTEDAVTRAVRLAKVGVTIPPEALDSLDKAGHIRALNNFYYRLLANNPDLPLWGQYISTAARTGSTEAMLELLQRSAARKRLSAARVLQVRFDLYRALFAADRIDAGVAVLRQVLASTTKGGPPGEDVTYADMAAQLLRIGRLMKRADWEAEGVRLLRTTMTEDSENEFSSENPIRLLIDFGYDALVEKILTAQIKSQLSGESADDPTALLYGEGGATQQLTELAGLYARRGRHQDVLVLLNEAKAWGAKDLSEIYQVTDSAETPLGYMAAAALAAQGEKERAAVILRAVISHFGGFDPAYKLLVSLEAERALPFFEEVYSRNQFEERPLIWKAYVLQQGGKLEEAEQAARAAIAVDPSDGEQGKGDRMRVYAVLADIREARGDIEQAKLFRGAVKAIRLSEEADDWYAAGLLHRGINKYKQSLTYFSDAYCIQSRLAIQLSDAGRTREAEVHYRRAYELMPSSFGRMESHCFGCERAFEGARAEGIAEWTFRGFLAKEPYKPQVHYLLGYLREEQSRYREALPLYKRAVQLDRDYLNAWVHIQGLSEHMQLSAADRDAAALNLLRLDPQGRNAEPQLNKVSNLRVLWHAVDAALKRLPPPVPENLYALPASKPIAEKQQEQLRKLLAQYGISDINEYMKSEMRMSMRGEAEGEGVSRLSKPGEAIANHQVMVAIAALFDLQVQPKGMSGRY